jgi:hypothetical protein
MTKYIALACDFGAHSECEGGDPDEVTDYGTRYGWNECKCPCHKKDKENIAQSGVQPA